MDQEDGEHERDEGSYQLSHVWDKLLHTDDRHRKSVLIKATDVNPKRRRPEANVSATETVSYWNNNRKTSETCKALENHLIFMHHICKL